MEGSSSQSPLLLVVALNQAGRVHRLATPGCGCPKARYESRSSAHGPCLRAGGPHPGHCTSTCQ